MPDKKKVQFIICTTDQRELEECKFYIRKLQIPEGVEIEVTEVSGAESMTAGYNAAMQSCEAKYRIYLHQDAFVVYPRMLYDLLRIFESNSDIGMLGVVGITEIPKAEMVHKVWNLGRVDTNEKPLELNYQRKKPECTYYFAEAVDGLFIATQQDVLWREDLFHKFDFYDVSQALEMRRKGYDTVVPYQQEVWCWHDNETSKFADYEGERQIFAREYQDIREFECGEIYQFSWEQETVLEEFQREILGMVDAGNLQEVELLLEQYHDLLCSKAKLILLENICYVRRIERLKGVAETRLYGTGMKAEDLLAMFREDKFCMKRIEYGYGDETVYLLERYKQGELSKEAVYGLAVCYAKDREKVMDEFEKLTDIRS